jgi:hypothetical protein
MAANLYNLYFQNYNKNLHVTDTKQLLKFM